MQKHKVFFDALSIAGSRMSGIGHVTLETVRALSKDEYFCESHDLILVVPLGKKHQIQSYNINAAIKVLPLPARIFNLIQKFNLLPPLDIIIGKGTYVFPNYRNWPLLRSRSITYVHDLSFLLYPELVEKKNLRYLVRNIDLWISRADIIVTGSQTVLGEIVAHYPGIKDKLKVIPHGIDTIFSEIIPKEKVVSTKIKYGFNTKNYFLYVGNIEPRKNLELIIEAHKALPRKLASIFPLVIIGGGGWRSENIDIAIARGIAEGTIIKPSKYVEDKDLPAIYYGATALVQVALYEGFGISPLQSLATGTPVLLSNIAVFREIFENTDGVYFAEPQDVNSIRSKLITILKSTHKLNRWKKYSWALTAKRLANIIETQE